ncbi:hypothetical protein Ctob_016588, partial [Chrysochromulina tobinii]
PKQAAIATKPHDAKLRNAKLSNVTERNTPATIVSIDAAKPWHALWTADNTTATRIADVFSGTVVKMPRDGTCLLHSLLNSLKLGDAKEMREQVTTWLRANPNHPFAGTTLADLAFGETGEQWQEYCNRMQHEHVWAGIPELVASAHVYRACIRVFANAGPGRFHLWAVLGEMPTVLNASIPPIDVVYGSNHYDSLVGTRLLKPWEHEAKQTDKLATPAPHKPEKTVVPAAPKEPATPAQRELEKTAASATPKEPETTANELVHAELDSAKEATVLERLEQQRRSTPLDLQALLAHPDPLPMLGELLYQLIECHNVELPGKITGMLLEGLSLDELHSLLASLPPGDAAAALASWISAARQTLLEAAEAITDEHHTELATAALCKPEAHGVSTAPKEPVVPAPDKPERARDRCQKLKAREELAARESKAREELATREELAKSEARRAREQHETWKKRDESRASDQACQLAETLLKDLPRPETVDWSPTFKVGDTNRARVTDERATHVLLLFAAVDTPMPPPLGIALCASILRSTPHAPYLRGAAPRVFGKATPKAKTKEEKDSEQ